jgi:hypothetical protein
VTSPEVNTNTDWKRWYDLPVMRTLALTRWCLRDKYFHPRRKRLAKLRALYWTLIRRYETELCQLCGGPVRLCFHVPDAIWEAHAGFRITKRRPGGEAAPGVLCPVCFTDLAADDGAHCLWWTCGFDDELMVG